MAPRIFLLALVTFGGSCIVYGQNPEDEWHVADLQTGRLAPEAFPELPQNIMQDLQARGCTIPQPYSSLERHNVIHGEFARKGQVDWAVLCSQNRVSSILIFWDSSREEVSKIANVPDRNWLQGIGGGKIGYSRAIVVVGEKYILDHYKAYGGTKPPPITHAGINDAFLEKASTVHYYNQGKWLELTGAD